MKRDARKSGQQGADNNEKIDELAAEQAEKMVKVTKTILYSQVTSKALFIVNIIVYVKLVLWRVLGK